MRILLKYIDRNQNDDTPCQIAPHLKHTYVHDVYYTYLDSVVEMIINRSRAMMFTSIHIILDVYT